MTGLAGSARAGLIAVVLVPALLGCTGGVDEIAGVGPGVSTEASVGAAENGSVADGERSIVAVDGGSEADGATGSGSSAKGSDAEEAAAPSRSDDRSESITTTEPGGTETTNEQQSMSESSPSTTATAPTSLEGSGVLSTTTLGGQETPSSGGVDLLDPTQPGDGILLAVLIIAANGDLDAAIDQGLITVDDVEAALAAIAEGNLDEYIPEG